MKDTQMSRERFEELAEIHGGAVARWPVAVRTAANALVAADPHYAREVLARAEALDAVLDAWRPPSVGHDLRERVIAAAPAALRREGRFNWLWGAGAGAGLCAACAAGLVLGVLLQARVTAPPAGEEAVSAVMTSYEAPLPTDSNGAAT